MLRLKTAKGFSPREVPDGGGDEIQILKKD